MRRITALAAFAAVFATHALGATNKVGSAAAASRLDALKSQYDAAVKHADTTLLSRSLDALNAYGKGLAAAQESLQRQGKLDAFLLIQAEKKRFDSEKTVLGPSGKAEAAELDRLTGVYNRALSSARADQMKSMLALKQRYAASLDRLVKELMLSNDIEQATKANDESKRVQAEMAALQSELPSAEQATEQAAEEPRDESAEPGARRSSISRIPLPLRPWLVLCYSFDREEKGKVTDSSAKKNTGKVMGARWTPKGKVGGAYQFDGGADYIDTLNPSLANGFKEVTVSVWAHALANTHCAGIASACSPDSKHLLMMTEGGGGKRQPTFYVGNGTRYDGVSTAPGVFAPGAWHHLAGTWKSPKGGGDGLLRIYFDGVLSSTSSTPLDGLISQTTSLKIGWDDVPLVVPENRRFNGFIDEVMIFDHALTERDIRKIYDSQK